jgi:hypothetical protein
MHGRILCEMKMYVLYTKNIQSGQIFFIYSVYTIYIHYIILRMNLMYTVQITHQIQKNLNILDIGNQNQKIF